MSLKVCTKYIPNADVLRSIHNRRSQGIVCDEFYYNFIIKADLEKI